MGDPKSLKKGNREFIQHCDDSKKLTCVYKSFDERDILEIDGRCIENRRLGRIYQNIYYKINTFNVWYLTLLSTTSYTFV